MDEKNEILSIKEVAQHLRCSKTHVYNAINGKIQGIVPLPVIPIGRRKLVRRTSLETWTRANEVASEHTQSLVEDGA